jgi:hypothetical protein
MRKTLEETRADYAAHLTRRPQPPPGWWEAPHSDTAKAYQKDLQMWVTQEQYLFGKITAAEFPTLVLDRQPKSGAFTNQARKERERTAPRPRVAKPRPSRAKQPLTEAERLAKAESRKRCRERDKQARALKIQEGLHERERAS